MSISKINRILITCFLYILFFIIIYNETETLFGVKISILWKAPIIIYLLIFNLKDFNKKLLGISIFLAINLLINTGFPGNSFGDLPEIVDILTLPLVYYFAKNKFKNNPEKLKAILISTCVFFIISTIPFIFNLIEQRGLIKNLDNFVSSGNMLMEFFIILIFHLKYM